MDCREAERFSDLSLDGETEPSEQAAFDAHVTSCGRCSERFHAQSWYQNNLRQKLQESSDRLEPPSNLKVRITAQISEERRPLPWATPALVAAGLAAVAGFTWSQAGGGLDPEEPVARHTHNLPPEVRARGDVMEVSRFLSAHLEYPVELPRFNEQSSNVRLVGARLASIANRDAAYVMYDQRGARISLFAYPKPRRFEPPPGFTEREAHGRTLQIGTHRGYNVVTWLSGNTVYALVSEVDHDRLVELAASQDR